MSRAALARGARVAASSPRLPLLATAGAAGLLLGLAASWPRSMLGSTAVLLGLMACGAAAAYLLDEESGDVLDATPTGRAQRLRWRLALLLLPTALAAGGLLLVDRQDPAGGWWWLAPFAAGSIALGTALAAVFKRSWTSTPGDLAGLVLVATLVFLVAVNPLRHWVAIVPAPELPHAGRSVVLWLAVIASCAVLVAGCSRDPARPAGIIRPRGGSST